MPCNLQGKIQRFAPCSSRPKKEEYLKGYVNIIFQGGMWNYNPIQGKEFVVLCLDPERFLCTSACKVISTLAVGKWQTTNLTLQRTGSIVYYDLMYVTKFLRCTLSWTEKLNTLTYYNFHCTYIGAVQRSFVETSFLFSKHFTALNFQKCILQKYPLPPFPFF